MKVSIHVYSDAENEEGDRDVKNDITFDNEEDIINADSLGDSADDVLLESKVLILLVII